VHFKLGNYKDARFYLRRALEQAPKNREILAHLKAVMEAEG